MVLGDCSTSPFHCQPNIACFLPVHDPSSKICIGAFLPKGLSTPVISPLVPSISDHPAILSIPPPLLFCPLNTKPAFYIFCYKVMFYLFISLGIVDFDSVRSLLILCPPVSSDSFCTVIFFSISCSAFESLRCFFF